MARTGKIVGGRPVPAPATARAETVACGDLTPELTRLEELDLGQLRTQYRNRSGRIAPGRITRGLLLRVLVYRMQAERFGDLRPDTRRMLDRLGQQRAQGIGAPPIDVAGQLKPGTILTREWQGRTERVMVLGTGFTWNGGSYASLSATALAITGTRWNGYRFFGLQSPKALVPVRSKRSTSEPLRSAEESFSSEKGRLHPYAAAEVRP